MNALQQQAAEQTPKKQLQRQVFHLICSLPISIASLVIGVLQLNQTADCVPEVNYFLITYGSVILGSNLLFLIVMCVWSVSSPESKFDFGMINFATVGLAVLGLFIWGIILRFNSGASCESAGNSLWTMFVVVLVFSGIGGICLACSACFILCAFTIGSTAGSSAGPSADTTFTIPTAAVVVETSVDINE